MTQRNNMISVLRVVAMLAIILLHLFSYFGIYEYGILNIFIYVFFIISGYLYSSKIIDNKKTFIISRIKKILVPMWIWSFILSVYVAIKGNVKLALYSFIISLFNLNGLDSIVLARNILDNYQIPGLYHCWFVTNIFICYIIMAFIKDRKIELFIKEHRIQCLLGSFICQILLVIFLKVQIVYIIVFFIGYFGLIDKTLSLKGSILLFISSLCFGLLRIYLHTTIDGSIIYDYVIQPSFNTVFSFFVVFFSLFLYRKNTFFCSLISGMSNNNIFRWLENNSYYLYIVHYAFIKGPLNFVDTINNSFIKTCLIIIFSCISSYLFYFLSKSKDLIK